MRQQIISMAFLALLLCFGATTEVVAQDNTSANQRQIPAPWRPAFGEQNKSEPETSGETTQLPAAAVPNQDSGSIPGIANNPGGIQSAPNVESASPQTQLTRVSRDLNSLPNSAGQIWREYDISPYTSQITSVEKPQQAILDWVLYETGTEMWFNEPLGILSADRNRLFVYHTPEIHNVVKAIVDRFVKTRGQRQTLDINLVTVENPNWRAQTYPLLQPIQVNSPGVEAWMVSKENAAILIGALSRRGDFRQHSAGRLTAHDGQEIVIDKKTPVQFIQKLRWVANQNPGFQPLMTQIDEGYRLSLSSLTSLDNRTIEATIKCDVDQVEKLESITVQIPGSPTPISLQIPQLVSWRLSERFRWPSDQVLLLSCGVVASPEPETGRPLPRLMGGNKKRADALVFIEYRGPATGAQQPAVAGSQDLTPVTPRR